MKNAYFAVAALVVFMFSACSDDKETTNACYLRLNQGKDMGDICVESKTEPATSSDCDELAGYANLAGGGVVTYSGELKVSCPSGYKLRCDMEDEDDGLVGYTFYYGSLFTGMTCEDL